MSKARPFDMCCLAWRKTLLASVAAESIGSLHLESCSVDGLGWRKKHIVAFQLICGSSKIPQLS